MKFAKRSWFWLPLLAAAAWISTGTPALAAHGHDELKVGKTGDVSFSDETKVGEVTLKPGRYKLQHRVEGEDHFVHFTEWSKPYPYYETTGGPKAHPGEVKCKLEPLAKKVSRTTVWTTAEDGTRRVTRVEVGGENVAHVF
jgi:hypothetical protein